MASFRRETRRRPALIQFVPGSTPTVAVLHASNNRTTTGTTITLVGWSTTPTAGNLLVALISRVGTSTASAPSVTGASGWTRLLSNYVSNIGVGSATACNVVVDAWWKVAAASEPVPSFTMSGAGTLAAMDILVYELTGANTASPLNASGTLSSGSASSSISAMTTSTSGQVTQAGSLAISWASRERAATTGAITFSAGWTADYAGGSGVSTAAKTGGADMPSPATGATAADVTSISGSSTSAFAAGLIVVIQPAAAAPNQVSPLITPVSQHVRSPRRRPRFLAPGLAQKTAFTFLNDFEEGTNGTTISTANSGGGPGSSTAFSGVTIGASATDKYDGAAAAHGSLSGKCTTPATATFSFQFWNMQVTQTLLYFRAYFNFGASLPPAGTRLVSFWQSAGASGAVDFLTVNASGFLAWANAGLAGTTVLPTNAWFRVEGFIQTNSAVSNVSMSLYTSMDSTTATETNTGSHSYGQVVGSMGFGISNSVASASYNIDDVGVTNTAPLGPVGGAPAQLTAAMAAASSFTPLATLAAGEVSPTLAAAATLAALATLAAPVTISVQAALTVLSALESPVTMAAAAGLAVAERQAATASLAAAAGLTPVAAQSVIVTMGGQSALSLDAAITSVVTMSAASGVSPLAALTATVTLAAAASLSNLTGAAVTLAVTSQFTPGAAGGAGVPMTGATALAVTEALGAGPALTVTASLSPLATIRDVVTLAAVATLVAAGIATAAVVPAEGIAAVASQGGTAVVADLGGPENRAAAGRMGGAQTVSESAQGTARAGRR